MNEDNKTTPEREERHQELVEVYDCYLAEYYPKYKIGDVGLLKHTGCPGLFTIVGTIPAMLFRSIYNIKDVEEYAWYKFDENWYKKTVYFCLFNQCQKAFSLEEYKKWNPQIKDELILECYEKNVPYTHCVWVGEEDVELFND